MTTTASTSTIPYASPASSALHGAAPAGTPLLEVRNLKTWFPIKKGLFPARSAT